MNKYKAHARPERPNTHKLKQIWREKNPNETYSYTAINYCSNSGKAWGLSVWAWKNSFLKVLQKMGQNCRIGQFFINFRQYFKSS